MFKCWQEQQREEVLKVCTEVQVTRQFKVFVSGRFDDDAVPEMKRLLEQVGCTRVVNYDVYPTGDRIDGNVIFHVLTDVDGEKLVSIINAAGSLTKATTEEMHAQQQT